MGTPVGLEVPEGDGSVMDGVAVGEKVSKAVGVVPGAGGDGDPDAEADGERRGDEADCRPEMGAQAAIRLSSNMHGKSGLILM
ncbi:MAG: hypothetical protein ACYDAG_09900 [Chloroflexota bacterium]